MKILIMFTYLSFAFSLNNDSDSKETRKHYGLSYGSKCKDYVKTFKCVSACKSIGFQIYRMDYKCKCSCHELKTTTILPFFKWGTNGTTKKMPETASPHLYHIVGTLSPPPTTANPEEITTEANDTDVQENISREQTTDISSDLNQNSERSEHSGNGTESNTENNIDLIQSTGPNNSTDQNAGLDENKSDKTQDIPSNQTEDSEQADNSTKRNSNEEGSTEPAKEE